MFGLDIMTGGLVTPPNSNGYEVVSTVDQKRNLYRKLVFQGDRLAGMVMVNDIEQGGVLLSTMYSETPVTVPKESLLSRQFNYKQLLR